jgi:LysR family carnitine catabolism transcriptional activator
MSHGDILHPSKTVEQPASLNVTIKHLRAFLAVAHYSSFTRAALSIHLSQPSLTMAIRQLEDVVGSSLFDRTTRSVILTPEGSDFLPIAERLVGDFDIVIQDVQQSATRRRHRMSVALVHAMATRVIPEVLPKFMKAYPEIRAQFREGNSSDVRQRVRKNEVDFGFCSKEDDDVELNFQPLFRDRIGLLMRRGHPLANSHKPLSWSQVTGDDFIGLTSDTATGPLLTQVEDLPQPIRKPRFEVSMVSTQWSMLEAGIGISTIPAMATFGGTNSSLMFRPLVEPEMWRTVFTVTRRGRSTTRTGIEFIQLTRTRIASMAKATPLIELLQT